MSAATLTRPTVVDQLLAVSVNVVVTLDGELDRSVEGEVTSRIALATHSADSIQIDARSCGTALVVRAGSGPWQATLTSPEG